VQETKVREPVKEQPKPAQKPQEKPTPKIVPKVPTQPPKTSYDFEKNLKSLDAQGKYDYLRIIPPETFKTILKESLTSEILLMIVNTIANYFLKDGEYTKAYSILSNIALTSRFEMTVMFLEDEEKTILEKIFDELEKNVSGSTTASLRSKYLP
jgi:hypothetical protein